MSIYNGEKYLNKAIESILNQTFRDFEFIIIDDGSRDRSFNIIESYSKKDNRIRIIKNLKNVGLTKSLNDAIKLAQGEFIARQDDDDISISNRLEKQIGFLKENPEYAFCGCNGFQKQRDLGLINFFDIDEIRNILIIENCFAHPTLFIRKEIFEKYGYYNEKFRYGQDYELFCRLIYKYKLKAKNLEDKLIIMHMPFTKIKTKNVNKFLIQRFNSIKTKLMYLKFTSYKIKGICAILIRVLEMVTFSHLMGKFSKLLIKIKY